MTQIDDSAVFKTLRNLERNLTSAEHRRAFLRAARKGGNILKDEVRNSINDTGTFEHIGRVKRGVKVFNSKNRKSPGVNIYIKGPDVPVGQGKNRRFWKLSSYSVLVMKGNYRNPGRKTKQGKRRGDVKGTQQGVNPFLRAVRTQGNRAMNATNIHMVTEVKKEIAKSVVRNG